MLLGHIDVGKDPATATLREMKEETGHIATMLSGDDAVKAYEGFALRFSRA